MPPRPATTSTAPAPPRPQHAVIWYETVFAFLAEHVLGEQPARPELL